MFLSLWRGPQFGGCTEEVPQLHVVNVGLDFTLIYFYLELNWWHPLALQGIQDEGKGINLS